MMVSFLLCLATILQGQLIPVRGEVAVRTHPIIGSPSLRGRFQNSMYALRSLFTL